MPHALGKFLLLLAGSGLSPREIGKIVQELQHFPPDLLANSIQRLRKTAPDHLDKAVVPVLSGPRQPRDSKGSPRPGSDVPMRVEFLLRSEAGLQVNQAAFELLESLKRERPSMDGVLKPPNKESLHRWLQKLLLHIGPSEMLHHATLVRNRYVHRTEQDWPLRRK